MEITLAWISGVQRGDEEKSVICPQWIFLLLLFCGVLNIKAVINKWVSCVPYHHSMSEGWWLFWPFYRWCDWYRHWITCPGCPVTPPEPGAGSAFPVPSIHVLSIGDEPFPWKVAPEETWLRHAGARGQLRCDRHSVWLFPRGEPGAAVSLRVVLKHTILIHTQP